jgi:uncharacterized protein (UPF0333 family)
LLKKGQIAVEYIIIAVFILIASSMAFKLYKEVSLGMLTEATIRTSVDWELATAALNNASCGKTFLATIYRNGTSTNYDYNVSTTDFSCTDTVINNTVKSHVNELVMFSLGCDYNATSCKGSAFRLV